MGLKGVRGRIPGAALASGRSVGFQGCRWAVGRLGSVLPPEGPARPVSMRGWPGPGRRAMPIAHADQRADHPPSGVEGWPGLAGDEEKRRAASPLGLNGTGLRATALLELGRHPCTGDHMDVATEQQAKLGANQTFLLNACAWDCVQGWCILTSSESQSCHSGPVNACSGGQGNEPSPPLSRT